MSDAIRELPGSGGTNVNGVTVKTPYDNSTQGVEVQDFLQLMIAQLTNQDFMNPVDDTQYVAQLAQFSTMSAMQELSEYSQTNYVMSLVGKNVTCAAYGIGGQVNKETGIVQSVNFAGDEYTIKVNGKEFKLSQIMTANSSASGISEVELNAAEDMPLIQQDITRTTAKFRWEPPVSDPDVADELRYDVYYSETPDSMGNLEDLKANAKQAASNLEDPSFTLEGLEPGKTYYVNVVVRNAAGQESVYKYSTVNTKD